MFKTAKMQTSFWFGLSLIVAVGFALDGLHQAFQFPYTVHNDARQHVFWMQRFIDPALFPSDLIADYFQSVAPLGYAALYRLFAAFGIDPLLLSKCLPLVLGVVTTIYCFKVCTQIMPVPFAGFLSALLLNQNLWLRDDLASGTPRAFIYPLLLAFLYHLLQGSRLPCLMSILLQGLFYPQAMFIAVGVLGFRLWRCRNGPLTQQSGWRPYGFVLAGWATALLAILPYVLRISEFDPVITAREARHLPEFAAQGRSAFFVTNAWAYWLWGDRTGLFPSEWQYVLLFGFGVALPLLLRCPNRLPLINKIRPARVSLLLDLFLASLVMFCLAHLFLFRLHLPSRYTHHSWRILIALLDGIVGAVVWQAATAWVARHLRPFCRMQPALVSFLTGSLLVVLMVWPSYAVRAYPYRLGYIRGNEPALYAFLRRQPKDVLVVSLSKEADFIPVFAKRAVFVSEEYSIPYHTGYYGRLRQRTLETIEVQYSERLLPVRDFVRTHGIDFWIVDKDAFTPAYIVTNPWLMQFQPVAQRALDRLRQGKHPALSRLMSTCASLETQTLVVVDARCILTAGNNGQALRPLSRTRPGG